LLLLVSQRWLALAVERRVLLVAVTSVARILAPRAAVVFVHRRFSLGAAHTTLAKAPAD